MVAEVNPVLWLSGTDTRWLSVGRLPMIAATRSPLIRPSPPASISFGRPVLPPEAIDFNDGDTASGRGASDTSGPGSKSPGTDATTPRGSGRPTSSARGRRSSRPTYSASGSRDDSGWGIAPSFQIATTAATHSIELGSATVT